MEHQNVGLSALAFSIRSAFLHAAEGWRMRFYSAIRLRSRAGLPWGKAPYPKDKAGMCGAFAGRGGISRFGAIVPFIDGASEHWPHTIQHSAKHLFLLEGRLKNMLPYLASCRLFLILHRSNAHFNGRSHSKLSIPLVNAMIIAYKILLLALRRSVATPCFNVLPGVRSFASGYAVRI